MLKHKKTYIHDPAYLAALAQLYQSPFKLHPELAAETPEGANLRPVSDVLQVCQSVSEGEPKIQPRRAYARSRYSAQISRKER